MAASVQRLELALSARPRFGRLGPDVWPGALAALAVGATGAAGALVAGAGPCAPGLSVAVAVAAGALGLLALARSGTHRAETERLALHESAVVHARDAIIILEAEPKRERGRSVLFVNAAFTRMTGYGFDEVAGRSLHILRGPKSDPATLDKLRDALAARRPLQTELLNYRKDGSELWVELSLTYVEATPARRAHWVMIQRDIGERKRAEAELQAREDQLRALGDNIPGGAVYQISTAGTGEKRFDYVSAGLFQMLGLTLSELRADAGRFCARLHPEDAPRFRTAMDVSAGQLAMFDGEFRLRNADGEDRTVQFRAKPTRLGCGGTRWDGVMVDATRRTRLEEQLRHAQKMESVGQLAGGIAHDFNNLLTGLIGNLARVNLDPADPNAALVATAEKAAGRAAELTRKLVGFARKNQLLVAPVDVPGFVAEVTELLRHSVGTRVTIHADLAATPPVLADATLLHQALVNLMLNARDAMPHGGAITVSSRDVTLVAADLTAHPAGRAGAFVRLTVADTGTGMPPAVVARLFEPFFTTKPLGQGTGLGLAMVHGIVQQHRGWVECDSVEGAGTRFHVYLPPADAVPAPKPGSHTFTRSGLLRQPLPRDADPIHTPPPARDLPPLGGQTILLVDDEEMIRDLGRAILESVGYRVLEAADGAGAIERYRRDGERIDLVILDLMMPVVSGREAFGVIRGVNPSAQVLFSSGYSADDLADLAGAAGLLSKPYRPAELLGAVGRALADGAQPAAVAG